MIGMCDDCGHTLEFNLNFKTGKIANSLLCQYSHNGLWRCDAELAIVHEMLYTFGKELERL